MAKYNIVEGDGTLRGTANSIPEAIRTTQVDIFRNGTKESLKQISGDLAKWGEARITDITFDVSFWIQKA